MYIIISDSNSGYVSQYRITHSCNVVTKNTIMQGADYLYYIKNKGTDESSACHKFVKAE
jgi:hypothetical protein